MNFARFRQNPGNARISQDAAGEAMLEILNGLWEAFRLIVTLDADLIEITLRSLQVTVTAVVIASAIGLPFGAEALAQLHEPGIIVARLLWVDQGLRPSPKLSLPRTSVNGLGVVKEPSKDAQYVPIN